MGSYASHFSGKVLGIDPGFGRAGWAIVESAHGVQKAIAYDCIETPTTAPLEERIYTVFETIGKVIDTYKPDVVALENLYFGANAKTAIDVGQARGGILIAAYQKKIPLSFYTPLQVKMAISGYGSADKKQVHQMVAMMLKITKMPKLDDTTDAIAIALTHCYSLKGI